MTIEAHYERLLFRARAAQAAAEVKLTAYEDFVHGLASGAIPWTRADHAAQALLDQVTKPESDPPSVREDNQALCAVKETSSNEKPVEWECGRCGFYLGSQVSSDFGRYPCVCGKLNRPRRRRQK